MILPNPFSIVVGTGEGLCIDYTVITHQVDDGTTMITVVGGFGRGIALKGTVATVSSITAHKIGMESITQCQERWYSFI